jgi:hypothetical protein
MKNNQKTCTRGKYLAALLLVISVVSCRNRSDLDIPMIFPEHKTADFIPYRYGTNSSDMKFSDVSNYMLNVQAANYAAWSNLSENTSDSTNRNNQPQKMIRDGVLVLKSDNIERSTTEIDSLIRAFHVQVESENLENEKLYMQKRYELRVNYSQFDALLIALQSTHNEVLNLNIQARDMTNEYVDIEMRANHERIYLETYKDLLRKATNMKDVLKIKSHIQQLEEEIESKTKQLQQIDAAVFMSKLSLTVTQPIIVEEVVVETTFKTKVVDSLSAGWNSILNLLLWIVSLWPILLATIVVVLLIKSIIRKRRKVAAGM